MASQIHKERTGKGLKISEEIVLKEEMYEEEDDLPSAYRILGGLPFPPRFQAYATVRSAMKHAVDNPDSLARTANHQQINREFDEFFGPLTGAHQSAFSHPALSPSMMRPPVSTMAGSQPIMNPTAAHASNPPVSPGTVFASNNSPISPGVITQSYSPMPQHMASPMPPHLVSPMPQHIASPMMPTPQTIPASPTFNFFGAQPVVSSPLDASNLGFPLVSPTTMLPNHQRSMSVSYTENASIPMKRRAVTHPPLGPRGHRRSHDEYTTTLATQPVIPGAMDNFYAVGPPPKRRRSEQGILTRVQHEDSMGEMLGGAQGVPAGFPNHLSFPLRSVVLQNPPAPKLKPNNEPRTKYTASGASITPPSRKASRSPAKDELVDDNMRSIQVIDTSTKTETEVSGADLIMTQTAPAFVFDQDNPANSIHDDFNLVELLNQNDTFDFSGFAVDDNPLGNWEDLLNMPVSQLDQ